MARQYFWSSWRQRLFNRGLTQFYWVPRQWGTGPLAPQRELAPWEPAVVSETDTASWKVQPSHFSNIVTLRERELGAINSWIVCRGLFPAMQGWAEGRKTSPWIKSATHSLICLWDARWAIGCWDAVLAHWIIYQDSSCRYSASLDNGAVAAFWVGLCTFVTHGWVNR